MVSSVLGVASALCRWSGSCWGEVLGKVDVVELGLHPSRRSPPSLSLWAAPAGSLGEGHTEQWAGQPSLAALPGKQLPGTQRTNENMYSCKQAFYIRVL